MNRLVNILEKLLLLNLAAFVLFFYHSKLFVKIILVIGITLIIFLVILKLALSCRKKLDFAVTFQCYFANRLIKPLNVFLLSAIVSVIFSLDLMHSQRVLFERFIPYFFFFGFGCYLAKSKRNLYILTVLFMIGGLVIGITGLKEYHGFAKAGRLYLLFGRPFNFAPFLLFLLPLNFAVTFFAKNKLFRILAAVSLITWIICYYWIFSRAIWLAVPVALLAVTFLKSKRLAVILLLIFIFSFPLLTSSFKSRVSTVLDTLTWGGRIDLYKSAAKVYQNFPVFGAGLGMYEKVLHQYMPEQIRSKYSVHLHAHSTYLEIAANMGTFGILSFLGIFVVFFIALLKNKPLWEKRSLDEQAILLGLSTSILASLIVAFATTIIIVGVQDPAIFWFFFGIASSLI